MTRAATSMEPGAITDDGIALCVPEIRGNEWAYIKECLDTGWVSSVGSYVTRFEKMLSSKIGVQHAISAVNGTAALHIALLCAGVQPDDEVLVSTLTFIAPANAIRYAGAHPVFIDAEPDYWQMDPAALERFLTEACERRGDEVRNRRTNRRVKAVVPVDILGSPVDFDRIFEIAKRFGLSIVEDATESLGTLYKNRPAGQRADVSCFSFNGNKLITTGGGGMIATDDAVIAQRAHYLTTQAKDDPLEYVHGTVGYNYRLTNVLAAMGVAQMELVDEYVEIKRRNAQRYTEALSSLPGITVMPEAPYARNTYWLYTILVDEVAFGMSSRELLGVLARQKIQTRPLWQPMHQSPAHHGEQTVGGDIADRLCRQALSLPSSVGLQPFQVEQVIHAIRGAAR